MSMPDNIIPSWISAKIWRLIVSRLSPLLLTSGSVVSARPTSDQRPSTQAAMQLICKIHRYTPPPARKVRFDSARCVCMSFCFWIEMKGKLPVTWPRHLRPSSRHLFPPFPTLPRALSHFTFNDRRRFQVHCHVHYLFLHFYSVFVSFLYFCSIH